MDRSTPLNLVSLDQPLNHSHKMCKYAASTAIREFSTWRVFGFGESPWPLGAADIGPFIGFPSGLLDLFIWIKNKMSQNRRKPSTFECEMLGRAASLAYPGHSSRQRLSRTWHSYCPLSFSVFWKRFTGSVLHKTFECSFTVQFGPCCVSLSKPWPKFDFFSTLKLFRGVPVWILLIFLGG